MTSDVQITGSVNGVGFAALVDLCADHRGKRGSRLCIGLDFGGAAPHEKRLQVKFDAVNDHAAILELLGGLFRELEPLFVGAH